MRINIKPNLLEQEVQGVMRLLLVQPTTKYPDRRPLRSRTRWLVGITLPYLAGLTPKNVVVDLADDRLEAIPYGRPYDLVGVTCTCATSPRDDEIAESQLASFLRGSMNGWTTFAPKK
jgi:hypothetical protein